MKPGRQKSKEEQQKENPHTLTDYMVKKFTGLRSWRMFQFFGEKVGISLEASPRSFYVAARKYPGHDNPAGYTGWKIHQLGYFHPIANNLMWTRIAIIRHYYWIVYICCGSILFLVLILFPFVLKSLSYITIPKDKGK